MTGTDIDTSIRSKNLFPVVGVGASAGGLDAFKRLIRAIPGNSGMAYILVQHLHPDHESALPAILQKETKIPVLEISDNITVLPDHIYIIPSNKLLVANDGILKLGPRNPPNQRNMAIDLFFSSLAEVHQSHAIAVILSGTGTDGTLGLKSVKDHGGLTFAQDPGTAAYDAMPLSAINSDVADFILPPEEIPKQLLHAERIFNGHKDQDTENRAQQEDELYRQILTVMRMRRGIDFTYYKQTTIRRRIARRMVIQKLDQLADYLNFLKTNKPEQDKLFQDLLIPVTEFFRDRKTFELICSDIIPELIKTKSPDSPLRIWVTACSTGEEAYSLAMCIHEYLGEDAANYQVQIFATDISELSITKARSGVYSTRELEGVSEKQLQQFFNRVDGSYQVSKPIRDMCVFAVHNFLKDPPFAKIDLLSCRNVLIYMDQYLQKKAFIAFHYALNEKGILLLGKSETTGRSSELFAAYGVPDKIFIRKQVPGSFLQMASDRRIPANAPAGRVNDKIETRKEDFQKNADDILLSKYTPAGVIVNDHFDIVQFRGITGPFLEPSPGKASLNVLKMAKEGLSFELRNALHKAKASNEPVQKDKISINDGKLQVHIEVIPLLNTIEPHFLILFTGSQPEERKAGGRKGSKPVESSEEVVEKDRQIRQLEKDLIRAREDMRSVTEDQEAANEELQSTNEELLSSSEELQSLNEELETSKEEIQSTNEELMIMNQELQERNEQLGIARQYSESIIRTLREPLLVLDQHFRIKNANLAFYEKFKVKEEDAEGKTVFEFENYQWDIPALRKLLQDVMSANSIEHVEITHDFPGIGKRTFILNARRVYNEKKLVDLLLLAFEDVTEKLLLDQKLQEELRNRLAFTEELEKQVVARTKSLKEANIQLEHSNKDLEQFASIASHDLQEPLRKIQTFSMLLQQRFSPDLAEEAKQLLNKISESSARMSVLIQDVLNFSRISYTERPFRMINLDDVVDNTLKDFDTIIQEKNAVIEKHVLGRIEGIPLQIDQLLYNLLSNALKFTTGSVEPKIMISTKIIPGTKLENFPGLNPATSYCELRIEDNGIGFEQQYADEVFLIFHRLNSRDQFSGTGIGLAICQKIVNNHHGKIYATAKENEGALFIVILPVKQDDTI